MITLLLFACSSDLALVGSWEDDFGGTHTVTNERWVSGSSEFAITDYDNKESWLVAQNDMGNDFNPDLWSRMDWLDDGTEVWLCQTVFDGDTESAALSATPADSGDLDTGCGGFPWSMLTPR